MGAADTYIQGYTGIMRDLARSQAEARLQSGQAWAGAIGQVGQIAANLPGQLADERRAKQQEAIWQANLDEFNRNKREHQVIADAINSSFDEATGDIDERRLAENFRLMGAAELTHRALTPIREAKLQKANLDNALMQGRINQAEYQQRIWQTLAPYAPEILESNGDPAVLAAALAGVRVSHGPQMAEALRQSIAQEPSGVLPAVQGLIQPKEPEKPMVVGEGAMVFDPNTGQMIAENPKPEPKKSFQQVPITHNGVVLMSNFDPTTGQYFKPGSDVPLTGSITPVRPPQTPREVSRSWAFDPATNQTILATDDEIIRRGLQQPPTADMRNKEAAKKVAARAVDAVRKLGEGIFTKVGPAQRAQAIQRGAEAVFGNDPEFRTYQDSRMALAGTLAVEQQGSRVSDADVKALWLPMVPDAYRDTKESYKLKWDLIDAMRGVDGSKAPEKPADLIYDPVTKTFKKGGG